MLSVSHPGVSLTEAQEFVDLLYWRQKVISDRHFTVREDTGVADEFFITTIVIVKM